MPYIVSHQRIRSYTDLELLNLTAGPHSIVCSRSHALKYSTYLQLLSHALEVKDLCKTVVCSHLKLCD